MVGLMILIGSLNLRVFAGILASGKSKTANQYVNLAIADVLLYKFVSAFGSPYAPSGAFCNIFIGRDSPI